MNKLTKILAWVGLSSVVVYIVAGLKAKPSNFQKHENQTHPDDSNKSNSDTVERNHKETKNVTDYSDSRTQKMYKDLGMNEEQRRRYERDYRTVMGTWEKGNPNYVMNEQQQIDEHNSVLSAVLNEAQYAMYREWFKINPA